MYPQHWNLLANLIFEGNVYDLTNFVVKEQNGNLRPVSSNKLIVLSPITTVNHVPLEVTTIPRHKFEIVKLSDMYDRSSSNTSDETPMYGIGKF